MSNRVKLMENDSEDLTLFRILNQVNKIIKLSHGVRICSNRHWIYVKNVLMQLSNRTLHVKMKLWGKKIHEIHFGVHWFDIVCNFIDVFVKLDV